MKIKAAITQFSMSENYEENIAKADSLIEKAAKEGANLILLPELFEGRYFCQVEDYRNFSLAESFKDSKTIDHFSEMAKKHNVVLPISFFEKAGVSYFNSLALIDGDGKVLGLYRKSHIPTGECYEEKFYFSEGDTGFKVFKTKLGKIGIGICWDQWFPETARILTLMGAEVLLYLASNRVRLEKAGSSSMTFFGSSFIADQHGDILEEMNRTEEGFRVAELDLDKFNDDRIDWGVFRDRRTDLYGGILKKTLEE